MTIAVKPGYSNPLSMLGKNQNRQAAGPSSAKPEKQSDRIRNLQLQRQTLQNQILLLKDSGDGAGMSQETQEILARQLEKVSEALKAAESKKASGIDGGETRLSKKQARFDSYEPDQTMAPGLYQLQSGREKGYGVKFIPFSG